MPQGHDDSSVASRQVLDGPHMVSGDFQLTASTLQRTSRENKDLLVITPPTGRFRYIALNTTKKPFDNINVRKAVIAGFDRNAMRLVRGGELVGDIPTHMLPPGLPRFEEAGGMKGPGLDYMSHPAGDMALAAEYFKKAGYDDPRYVELCQGDLYQWIADQMGLDRKEVKEQLTQRGLFSTNGSKHQKTPVMRFFKAQFPLVYEYMTVTKAKPKRAPA